MAVLLTYRFWIGANRLGGRNDYGAKRLVGAKRLGGKRPGGHVLGAKRLRGEMVWGRNDPDSFYEPITVILEKTTPPKRPGFGSVIF